MSCVKAFFISSIFIAGFICLSVFPLYAGELQLFSNAVLVEHPGNDGDSFHVKAEGKNLHIRLYFVDCPEISANSKADAQRLREQTRYFGLSCETLTIQYGKKAKNFMDDVLSEPFTVYTAFASALGRSAKGRVYAFIKTSRGDDLSNLLVKKGLARTHGIGRESPEGISRNETIQRLQDLEIAAMLKREGIWSKSDPDRISELRAEQRMEDQKLKDLQQKVKKFQKPQQLIDLNTATKEELESIPGIGPVLAERIKAGRPYRSIDELLKIKGIGKKKLNKIRNYFITSDVSNVR